MPTSNDIPTETNPTIERLLTDALIFSSMLTTFNPARFYGRKAMVQSILPGISVAESPRSFALYGPRTIGKTALLKYLRWAADDQLEYSDLLVAYGHNPELKLCFLYIDFFSIEKSQVLLTLGRELLELKVIQELSRQFKVLENLAQKFWDLESKITETEEDAALQNQLIGVLRQIFLFLRNRRMRLAILLDHFDLAYSSLRYDEDLFLRDLTRYHSFVIATEKSLPELRPDSSRTSPLIGVVLQHNVGLLLDEEARDLLLCSTKSAAYPLTPQEADFLIDKAGRHPYLLALVADFFFNWRIQNPEMREALFEVDNKPVLEMLTQQLASLPAVTELFFLYYRELSDDERQALAKIARKDQQPNLETEQASLTALRQKALIYEVWKNDKYDLFVFSELFRNYVRRQLSSTAQLGEADINRIMPNLPPLDKKLFDYMRARPNVLLSFTELLEQLGSASTKRSLEVAVHRLRGVIESVTGSQADFIQSVRGQGYRYRSTTAN